MIRVRSTINLQGMPIGQEARVDETDPYIAGLIAAAYLVPVDDEAKQALLPDPDDAADGTPDVAADEAAADAAETDAAAAGALPE